MLIKQCYVHYSVIFSVRRVDEKQLIIQDPNVGLSSTVRVYYAWAVFRAGRDACRHYARTSCIVT